ncbi:unnamed protein product, partial [Rotaria magnacalcarata]
NTGGIADIVAQLCRKLSPTDELAQFRKSIYIEECKKELKKLSLKEKEAREQDEDIEKYVDVLNEMEELIIVFDAIEHNAKLEDTIADAILTGIKYQIENWEQFFCPNTKAALLLWCAVWGKDEYARQLLTDRKAETVTSANDAEQSKNQVGNRARTSTSTASKSILLVLPVIPLAQQILFEALHRNTVSFVSLLMEYGASIEELTEEQLIIICVKTMNDDALVLNKLHVHFTSVKRDAKLSELKKYVEQRYNDYLRQYLNHYVTKENDREKKRTKRQLARKPTGEQKISASFTPLSKIFDGRKTEALYLWFVFMNQPAMAKYLCSRSRELKASNPYRPVVIYAPPSSQKENTPSRFNTSNMLDRIKWFYEAPVIRFYYNLIFFVSFLALFSHVILVDYFPLNIYGETRSGIQNLWIPIPEIILHIWMWSLIIDELYQFISQIRSDYNYSSNAWNWMDQAGILFYLMAFFTRWFVKESFFVCSK